MDKSSRERVRAVRRGPCRSLLLVQIGPSQPPLLNDVMRCNPGARGGCGHGQSPGRRACQSLVYPPAMSYSSADSSLQSWGDQQPGMGALICSRTCGRMGCALGPRVLLRRDRHVWQCLFRRLERDMYMQCDSLHAPTICSYGPTASPTRDHVMAFRYHHIRARRRRWDWVPGKMVAF